MSDKPLVGISACLLGEKVRYDGGDKLDHYLRDILGASVEFVSVCPEAESGMGVPREAMRLVSINGDVRLMTQNTERDMTGPMEQWIRTKLALLSAMPLCGYIFKARSPSCGLMSVPCYQQAGSEIKKVSGIFARGLTGLFPLLPVVDEENLHDAGSREDFIARVYNLQRMREKT